jgi:glutamyl-Q tRNA(Asp) synthetase
MALSPYRGRFAPSPTGPLHFGSLVAAVASFCEARAHAGKWHLRMEDVDSPRCVPGAADLILRGLEACGFSWDGGIVLQTLRTAEYAAALERLLSLDKAYPCGCTRREVADSALRPEREPAHHEFTQHELIYPGTCRDGLPAGRQARSFRAVVGDTRIEFEDGVQGVITQSLASETGDFVLKRADGYFAYQLAVVVDDAAQRITDVVRGADLLGSTPRQIHLQRLLGLPTPRYAHVPVATDAAGEKLSKQTRATALDPRSAPRELVNALRFLGQQPPRALERALPRDLWAWADENWSLSRIPRRPALAA